MDYALRSGAEIALVCTRDGTVLADVRRKPELRPFDSTTVATLCGPLGAVVGTLNATLGQDARMPLYGPSLSLRLRLMENHYVLVALFPEPVHRELGDLCAEQLYERVKQWL